MLQIKLREIFGHEPTAEDYDHALQAIDELNNLAAHEREAYGIVLRMVQIGNKYFQEGVNTLFKLMTLGMARVDPELLDAHNHMFDPPFEAELRRLKKEADKMD